MIDFYNGDNYDLENLLNRLKEMKKYKQVIIIDESDNDNTTAIYELTEKEDKITKNEFTAKLPKMKKLKDDELGTNNNCTICQSKIVKNEYYRKLEGCNHIFHKKCIDQWFFKTMDYNCPLCRNNPYN